MNIYKRKSLIAAVIGMGLALGALANSVVIDGKPCTGCSVNVTTGATAPPTAPPVVPPPVVTPPPVTAPPVAGVKVVSANPWQGNYPQPVSYTMGADEAIAFKIPAGSFANDLYTLMNWSAPIGMAISNVAGDFGDAAGGQRHGCYNTVGAPQNPQQDLRAVSNGVETGMLCRTPPATSDGHLYLNVRWQVYTNFGFAGRLANFLKESGQGAGNFTLRRSS